MTHVVMSIKVWLLVTIGKKYIYKYQMVLDYSEVILWCVFEIQQK